MLGLLRNIGIGLVLLICFPIALALWHGPVWWLVISSLIIAAVGTITDPRRAQLGDRAQGGLLLLAIGVSWATTAALQLIIWGSAYLIESLF